MRVRNFPSDTPAGPNLLAHQRRAERTVQKGTAWTRLCPRCGAVLRRADPSVPVVCLCGWVWE